MKDSKIEWTDHTFNPWWGCTKVSPACDNCYAAALDKRTGGNHWGAGVERRRTSPANWAQPLKWNKNHEAFFKEHGRRQCVFCASMADVFDNEVDPQWRADLFGLILATPNLDWLLLTKRIGNANKMIVQALVKAYNGGSEDGKLLKNVWIGATICNQAEADRDIPKLLAVPAAKRFLSIEPLLSSVDVAKYLPNSYECGGSCGHRTATAPKYRRCCMCPNPSGMWDADEASKTRGSWTCPDCSDEDNTEFVCDECESFMVIDHPLTQYIDWVIVGGESGHGARPMHPDWARSLRDQCAAADVPFMFKQWGDWHPFIDSPASCMSEGDGSGRMGKKAFITKTGLPPKIGEDGYIMDRVGKKAAGRLLDGVEHNGVPA